MLCGQPQWSPPVNILTYAGFGLTDLFAVSLVCRVNRDLANWALGATEFGFEGSRAYVAVLCTFAWRRCETIAIGPASTHIGDYAFWSHVFLNVQNTCAFSTLKVRTYLQCYSTESTTSLLPCYVLFEGLGINLGIRSQEPRAMYCSKTVMQ